MCRNIRPLFNIDPPATPQEIEDAALQFVRKVSGYQKPSRLNQAAFDQAVAQVSVALQSLLEGLETSAPKRPAPRRNTASGVH
jgi:hypothetical protein